MRLPVIGLTGRIGCGKTTAALALCEIGFARWRFAGPLKAMLHALGLGPLHTDGELKELPCDILGGRTPRRAMQTLGTEWGRDLISPDLWVNAWKHGIEAMPQAFPIVADDLRFPNEAAAVRAMGGVVVRIERPGETSNWVHASEQFDFTADHLILNDRGIPHLEAAIVDLARGLFAAGQKRDTTVTDAGEMTAV